MKNCFRQRLRSPPSPSPLERGKPKSILHKKRPKGLRQRNDASQESAESDPYSLRFSKQLISSTQLPTTNLFGATMNQNSARSSNSFRTSKRLMESASKLTSSIGASNKANFSVGKLQKKKQRSTSRNAKLMKQMQTEINPVKIKPKGILGQRSQNKKILSKTKDECSVQRLFSQYLLPQNGKKPKKSKARRKEQSTSNKKASIRRSIQTLTDQEAKRLEKIFLIEYAIKHAQLLGDLPTPRKQPNFRI